MKQYIKALPANFFDCYLSCMTKVQDQRFVLSFESHFSDIKKLANFQCVGGKSTPI